MPKTYDDPAKLAIGSTVWYYNRDKRHYVTGSMRNIVTEREKFEPRKLVGETPVSWIVEGDAKIPKDPAKRDTPLRHGHYTLTEQAMDDACWAREHWSDVVSRVQHGCDAATFRAVGKLVGVE